MRDLEIDLDFTNTTRTIESIEKQSPILERELLTTEHELENLKSKLNMSETVSAVTQSVLESIRKEYNIEEKEDDQDQEENFLRSESDDEFLKEEENDEAFKEENQVIINSDELEDSEQEVKEEVQLENIHKKEDDEANINSSSNEETNVFYRKESEISKTNEYITTSSSNENENEPLMSDADLHEIIAGVNDEMKEKLKEVEAKLETEKVIDMIETFSKESREQIEKIMMIQPLDDNELDEMEGDDEADEKELKKAIIYSSSAPECDDKADLDEVINKEILPETNTTLAEESARRLSISQTRLIENENSESDSNVELQNQIAEVVAQSELIEIDENERLNDVLIKSKRYQTFESSSSTNSDLNRQEDFDPRNRNKKSDSLAHEHSHDDDDDDDDYNDDKNRAVRSSTRRYSSKRNSKDIRKRSDSSEPLIENKADAQIVENEALIASKESELLVDESKSANEKNIPKINYSSGEYSSDSFGNMSELKEKSLSRSGVHSDTEAVQTSFLAIDKQNVASESREYLLGSAEKLEDTEKVSNENQLSSNFSIQTTFTPIQLTPTNDVEGSIDDISITTVIERKFSDPSQQRSASNQGYEKNETSPTTPVANIENLLQSKTKKHKVEAYSSVEISSEGEQTDDENKLQRSKLHGTYMKKDDEDESAHIGAESVNLIHSSGASSEVEDHSKEEPQTASNLINIDSTLIENESQANNEPGPNQVSSLNNIKSSMYLQLQTPISTSESMEPLINQQQYEQAYLGEDVEVNLEELKLADQRGYREENESPIYQTSSSSNFSCTTSEENLLRRNIEEVGSVSSINEENQSINDTNIHAQVISRSLNYLASLVVPSSSSNNVEEIIEDQKNEDVDVSSKLIDTKSFDLGEKDPKEKSDDGHIKTSQSLTFNRTARPISFNTRSHEMNFMQRYSDQNDLGIEGPSFMEQYQLQQRRQLSEQLEQEQQTPTPVENIAGDFFDKRITSSNEPSIDQLHERTFADNANIANEISNESLRSFLEHNQDEIEKSSTMIQHESQEIPDNEISEHELTNDDVAAAVATALLFSSTIKSQSSDEIKSQHGLSSNKSESNNSDNQNVETNEPSLDIESSNEGIDEPIKSSDNKLIIKDATPRAFTKYIVLADKNKEKPNNETDGSLKLSSNSGSDIGQSEYLARDVHEGFGIDNPGFEDSDDQHDKSPCNLSQSSSNSMIINQEYDDTEDQLKLQKEIEKFASNNTNDLVKREPELPLKTGLSKLTEIADPFDEKPKMEAETQELVQTQINDEQTVAAEGEFEIIEDLASVEQSIQKDLEAEKQDENKLTQENTESPSHAVLTTKDGIVLDDRSFLICTPSSSNQTPHNEMENVNNLNETAEKAQKDDHEKAVLAKEIVENVLNKSLELLYSRMEEISVDESDNQDENKIPEKEIEIDENLESKEVKEENVSIVHEDISDVKDDLDEENEERSRETAKLIVQNVLTKSIEFIKSTESLNKSEKSEALEDQSVSEEILEQKEEKEEEEISNAAEQLQVESQIDEVKTEAHEPDTPNNSPAINEEKNLSTKQYSIESEEKESEFSSESVTTQIENIRKSIDIESNNVSEVLSDSNDDEKVDIIDQQEITNIQSFILSKNYEQTFEQMNQQTEKEEKVESEFEIIEKSEFSTDEARIEEEAEEKAESDDDEEKKKKKTKTDDHPDLNQYKKDDDDDDNDEGKNDGPSSDSGSILKQSNETTSSSSQNETQTESKETNNKQTEATESENIIKSESFMNDLVAIEEKSESAKEFCDFFQKEINELTLHDSLLQETKDANEMLNISDKNIENGSVCLENVEERIQSTIESTILAEECLSSHLDNIIESISEEQKKLNSDFDLELNSIYNKSNITTSEDKDDVIDDIEGLSLKIVDSYESSSNKTDVNQENTQEHSELFSNLNIETPKPLLTSSFISTNGSLPGNDSQNDAFINQSEESIDISSASFQTAKTSTEHELTKNEKEDEDDQSNKTLDQDTLSNNLDSTLSEGNQEPANEKTNIVRSISSSSSYFTAVSSIRSNQNEEARTKRALSVTTTNTGTSSNYMTAVDDMASNQVHATQSHQTLSASDSFYTAVDSQKASDDMNNSHDLEGNTSLASAYSSATANSAYTSLNSSISTINNSFSRNDSTDLDADVNADLTITDEETKKAESASLGSFNVQCFLKNMHPLVHPDELESQLDAKNKSVLDTTSSHSTLTDDREAKAKDLKESSPIENEFEIVAAEENKPGNHEEEFTVITEDELKPSQNLARVSESSSASSAENEICKQIVNEQTNSIIQLDGSTSSSPLFGNNQASGGSGDNVSCTSSILEFEKLEMQCDSELLDEAEINAESTKSSSRRRRENEDSTEVLNKLEDESEENIIYEDENEADSSLVVNKTYEMISHDLNTIYESVEKDSSSVDENEQIANAQLETVSSKQEVTLSETEIKETIVEIEPKKEIQTEEAVIINAVTMVKPDLNLNEIIKKPNPLEFESIKNSSNKNQVERRNSDTVQSKSSSDIKLSNKNLDSVSTSSSPLGSPQLKTFARMAQTPDRENSPKTARSTLSSRSSSSSSVRSSDSFENELKYKFKIDETSFFAKKLKEKSLSPPIFETVGEAKQTNDPPISKSQSASNNLIDKSPRQSPTAGCQTIDSGQCSLSESMASISTGAKNLTNESFSSSNPSSLTTSYMSDSNNTASNISSPNETSANTNIHTNILASSSAQIEDALTSASTDHFSSDINKSLTTLCEKSQVDEETDLLNVSRSSDSKKKQPQQTWSSRRTSRTSSSASSSSSTSISENSMSRFSTISGATVINITASSFGPKTVLTAEDLPSFRKTSSPVSFVSGNQPVLASSTINTNVVSSSSSSISNSNNNNNNNKAEFSKKINNSNPNLSHASGSHSHHSSDCYCGKQQTTDSQKTVNYNYMKKSTTYGEPQQQQQQEKQISDLTSSQKGKDK